jgi:hypothetical protein
MEETASVPPAPLAPPARFRELVTVLPPGYRPVMYGGRPLLVATLPGGVLGLIHDEESTSLVSVAHSGNVAETGLWLREVGTACRVTAFRPRLLTGDEPSPPGSPAYLYHGFQASLACGQREVSVFTFAREHGEDPSDPEATADNDEPYLLITPLSTVARTILRDLTGDGTLDLLRYSRLFEHGGRWELLLEALRWDGRDFVLEAETALLREVNHRLDRLERMLATPVSPEESERIDRALLPTGGAPPASSLIPHAAVRIPRITDLPLQPDLSHWELVYEIALDAEVYRLTMRIEANPLLPEPVGIEGIDWFDDAER